MTMQNLSVIFLVTLLSTVTDARTESFSIQPFQTEPSSEAQIQEGLKKLYKNEISAEELSALSQDSLQFQQGLYSILNEAISKNPTVSVKVSERRLTGNFVKETTIQFPSLVQRGGHASDTVVARIYEPSVVPAFCEYKFPTTIMLHHILNEVDKIQDVAKVIASGLLSQSSIVVVIQMPHYADRRQDSEEFLNSDLESFKRNITQTILDVQLLKTYLQTRANIDTNNLSLSGFSLGAVMGMTVGAFDQSFTGYGFLVGGVDMANILMNRIRNRPDSEVAVAMKDVPKDEAAIRHQIAPVDPMTWMHRYQNKRFFSLNAAKDDIVDFKNSVQPMIEALKEQGNKVSTRLNEDGHTPTGSAFKKLREVFFPLNDFLIQKRPSVSTFCQEDTIN